MLLTDENLSIGFFERLRESSFKIENVLTFFSSLFIARNMYLISFLIKKNCIFHKDFIGSRQEAFFKSFTMTRKAVVIV